MIGIDEQADMICLASSSYSSRRTEIVPEYFEVFFSDASACFKLNENKKKTTNELMITFLMLILPPF
ncbi:MAG: hypothetical protein A2X59_03930 [Nitrospirae bacterium GWC2_42_7]|nr:MAG: hypothetical protein A2X59_03930 [Nitrospirae bacterium GWC2_42_7]